MYVPIENATLSLNCVTSYFSDVCTTGLLYFKMGKIRQIEIMACYQFQPMSPNLSVTPLLSRETLFSFSLELCILKFIGQSRQKDHLCPYELGNTYCKITKFLLAVYFDF